MEEVWRILTHKFFSGAIYFLVIIYEVRKGFLRFFPAYTKTLRPGFYLTVFLLACAAAVTGILFFDGTWLPQIQTIRASWFLALIEFGEIWGKAGYNWGAILLVYFVSKWIQRPSVNLLAMGALASTGLTSLFIHIIKYIFARARPLVEIGPHHFFEWKDLWEQGSRYLSFASGDVAMSAGLMSFFFFQIKNPARFLFPAIAFLTCLSRIYLDKHWPSDTAFAFIVSFGFAKLTHDYLVFSRAQKTI